MGKSKLIRKSMATVMILAMAAAEVVSAPVSADAKAKAPSIDAGKSVNVGKTETLSIKANGSKIRSVKAVSTKKGVVKVVSASKKGVKIKGIKKGKATIKTTVQVKNGKKGKKKYKLSTRVTVEKETAGNPDTPTSVPVSTDAPVESMVPQASATPSAPANTPTAVGSDSSNSGGSGAYSRGVSLYATTPEELTAALKSASGRSGTLTYRSASKTAENVEIPSGNYGNIMLIVDAPYTTVVNSARFRSVRVEALSPDTWKEKAGNTIVFLMSVVHIIVEDGAGTKIKLGAEVSSAKIENNGLGKSISSLNINSSAKVDLIGSNKTAYAVNNSVADSVITTRVPIDLKTDSPMQLNVLAGAEDSAVTQTTAEAKVDIRGVGTITVTVEASNEVKDVTAEKLDEDTIGEDMKETKKGTVSGVVQNSDGTGIAGAKVFLYPYSSTYTDPLNQGVEAVKEVTTDDTGAYKIADIPYGNYYLVYDKTSDNTEGGQKKEYRLVTVSEKTTQAVVGSDVLRFVLTWDKMDELEIARVSPDLDSHLIVPAIEPGQTFHTYSGGDKNYNLDGTCTDYGNDKYFDMVPENNRYVSHDVDAHKYKGPETTTVYKQRDGEFHFYVYDTWNQDDMNNISLCRSNPKVAVYRGNKIIKTYEIPAGQTGTLWDVCSYNMTTNTLTTYNKVFFHYGSDDDIGQDETKLREEYYEEYDFFDVYDVEAEGVYEYFSDYDEDEKYRFIQLLGEEDTLSGVPKIIFDDEPVTVTYSLDTTSPAPSVQDDMGTWIGYLNASVVFDGKTRTQTFYVYYKKEIELPYLNVITTADGTKFYHYGYNDYDKDNIYYTFCGPGDSLGQIKDYGFRKRDDDVTRDVEIINTENVQDGSVRLTAKYKDVIFSFKIKYINFSRACPRYGVIEIDEYDHDLYADFSEDGNSVSVEGIVTESEFHSNGVRFISNNMFVGEDRYEVSYELTADNRSVVLKLGKYDETLKKYVFVRELATYPIVYTQDNS